MTCVQQKHNNELNESIFSIQNDSQGTCTGQNLLLISDALVDLKLTHKQHAASKATHAVDQ